MNADYKFYFAQLDAQAGKGQPPETTPGTPHAGFYRLRRRIMIDNPNPAPGESRKNPKVIFEPVAIWKDGEEWACAKPGFCPTKQDEIDDLFSRVCRDAVPEDVYRAVVAGGPWPDQVEERTPAERIVQPSEPIERTEPELLGPTETQQAMYGQGRADDAPENERATPGGNSGAVSPAAVMADRIADVNQQIADWLKEIGGKITTDEQADKAANFAALLGELEKEAEALHKVEKAPWLEGGRTVDAAWKPLIEKAATSKGRVKRDYVTPYLVEKQRRIDAEAKAERERIAAERAKAEQQAAAAGVEAPPVEEPPPPEPERVKAGTRGGRATALRTVKVGEITDLPALAAFIAGMSPPPAEFIEVCKKLAEKMMKAGVTVPGAKLNDEQRAS